ncbi:MAG: 23S rRNA (adenine(2503)-C(2))-methyltransferase RlmN [Deltaproteobacteria bacterium]|nr:23S rRNA (adenine(2503)-C(2))-methyltransferase RlmN [Deltaproteobacteria bacterium]
MSPPAPSAASPIHPAARLPQEWQSVLAARGEPPYRARQIFRWIHGRAVIDPAKMTDLPLELRAALRADGLADVATPERIHRSADGARKLVLRLRDGALIETVLLPAGAPGADDDADVAAADDRDHGADDAPRAPDPSTRVAQCVSTQVGCAMGCAFCASGAAGLRRQLGPEEIAGQVIEGRRQLDPGERLRAVVLMGMGEPLHNYDAVARAIRLLTDTDGVGLSPARITVSTCGLVPGIRKLGEDFGGRVGLAVSLCHADDAKRAALVPVARRHPLAELVAALREYPLPRRRRITVEYTLLRGENDTPADARRLVRLLRPVRVKVNLIPMNPIAGAPFQPPAPEAVLAFQQELVRAGYACFVRRRRGDDVTAACGQLAGVLDGAGGVE